MKSPTDENKKRLLSGIKPTGRIHIGNYFGALKQFVDLQDEYESFVFLPNLHALTENVLTKDELISNVDNAILDYLGAGLDPEKIILFKQSDVPAHASLAWIFNCLVTVPYLERAHAYKDAQAKGKEITAGTFTYPVLMASDILLYSPHIVPVGQDQKQHVEYARDIAEKFNFRFGELFKLPEPMILENVAVIPGTDGRKMSKSYNNTIPLFATDEEIHKAVMSIPTDSRRPEEEKNPDDLILYQIHKLFDSSAELRARYTQGLGYGDAKKLLIADIIAFVTPMRQRRKKYEQDPEMVEKILLHGAMRANEVAMKKLTEVYEAVGLTK
jgi:tryptophanyl-tRNA synthetase